MPSRIVRTGMSHRAGGGAVSRVREAYRTLRPVNCPSCRACMPCPQGIDVPRIFEIYNDAFVYGDVASGRSIYRDEGHDAGACTKCGTCESRCARRSHAALAGKGAPTRRAQRVGRASAPSARLGSREPAALARCEGAGQADPGAKASVYILVGP